MFILQCVFEYGTWYLRLEWIVCVQKPVLFTRGFYLYNMDGFNKSQVSTDTCITSQWSTDGFKNKSQLSTHGFNKSQLSTDGFMLPYVHRLMVLVFEYWKLHKAPICMDIDISYVVTKIKQMNRTRGCELCVVKLYGIPYKKGPPFARKGVHFL